MINHSFLWYKGAKAQNNYVIKAETSAIKNETAKTGALKKIIPGSIERPCLAKAFAASVDSLKIW